MKKAGLILLFGIAFLLIPHLVYAEEKAPSFGIGVSMANEVLSIHEQIYIDMFDYPSFYMPIRISPGFRLEPEIGLWRYSHSKKDGTDQKSSYSVLSLGCGILSLKNKGKVHIYYGARLRLVRMSEWSEYTWNEHTESNDDSKTDFYIGPAIGGEYLFADHLSLGGEVQLNYTFIGQFDDDDGEVSESLISSKTLIFVRWYF